MYQGLSIFSGRAGRGLAQNICKHLSIELGRVSVESFSDGEIQIQFIDELRERDVYLVNPTCPPTENIFELRLLAAAARRASAGRITLVITYLGYNRQDRKDRPRVPLSAEEVAEILSHHVDRVMLVDIHSEPTEGFFRDVRVRDHVYASPAMQEHLLSIMGTNFVVASDDLGGPKRARKYAHLLGVDDIVMFDKVRPKPNAVDPGKVTIIGDVQGKDVLIVADIVDTAGTICADAEKAKASGAGRIIACAPHALLSGNALERLDASPVEELVVTDTIPHPPEFFTCKRMKITVCTIAPFLATAIRRQHDGKSLSELIPA